MTCTAGARTGLGKVLPRYLSKYKLEICSYKVLCVRMVFTLKNLRQTGIQTRDPSLSPKKERLIADWQMGCSLPRMRSFGLSRNSPPLSNFRNAFVGD